MSQTEPTAAAVQAAYTLGCVIGENAACADLVRAAGCVCHLLDDADALCGARFEWAFEEGSHFRRVVDHDPRCPQALAAAIEARGR